MRLTAMPILRQKPFRARRGRKKWSVAFDFTRTPIWTSLCHPSRRSSTTTKREPRDVAGAEIKRATTPLPIRFQTVGWPGPITDNPPWISNVNLVHLSDAKRLDILACDMQWHNILALQPQAAKPAWKVLGKGNHPAHVEVVDLDGDGIKDILIANLGNFTPTDRLCGSVQLLRGRPDGTYDSHILLDGVGRVADVQAGDFRGVGKLDLIVAEFGYLKSGQILYLENQTTDWNKPPSSSVFSITATAPFVCLCSTSTTTASWTSSL